MGGAATIHDPASGGKHEALRAKGMVIAGLFAARPTVFCSQSAPSGKKKSFSTGNSKKLRGAPRKKDQAEMKSKKTKNKKRTENSGGGGILKKNSLYT